jgi:metallo-beta-lactamase class B
MLHPVKLNVCFLKFSIMIIISITSLCVKVQAQDRESLAKDPVLFLNTASKMLGWTEATEPLKIAGPIYFVGTKGLASYVIKTSQGLILMYTGMPGSGPMIEASIKKLELDPKDIKYILTGHAHSDHVGGHAYIKKISGAQVVMMVQEQELLESGGKSDFHYGKYPEFGFDPVKADVLLQDGDMIKLGEVVLTALLTPGHTKGGTTWVTNVIENGKAYTIVFPDGTSINPGYRLAKDPSYVGIENNYRNTLHILEMLKPDIWLSSHTDFFDFEEKRKIFDTEGVKAWIDPEGYRIRIAGERSKFEAEINTELGIPTKP